MPRIPGSEHGLTLQHESAPVHWFILTKRIFSKEKEALLWLKEYSENNEIDGAIAEAPGTVIPHMKEHQLFQVYQHLPDGRFMNGYGETALTVSQQESVILIIFTARQLIQKK